MSKLHTGKTATDNKKKTKNSLNASVSGKSTISIAAPKAATKKPLSEIKAKSTKAADEKIIRPDPQATKAAILQKSRPKVTTKPNSQQLESLRKQQPEKRTSVPVARVKNTLNRADLSGSSHTNAKKSLQQSKPNAVLDTFHNVTVSSPPLKRKSEPKKIENEEISQDPPQLTEKRTRTRTHTLDPDEIVVLRNESAKQRSQAAIEAQNEITERVAVKDPIFFEVNFEKIGNIKARTITTQEYASSGDDDEASYPDDFESYESDFETGSSSPTASLESENNQEEINLIVENEQSENEFVQEINNKTDHEEQEEDDESELTQYPITVIQRDKELERKLDSGNYEMHLIKQGKSAEVTAQQQQFDSLDTFSGATSEQLDSGISSYGNVVQPVEKKEQHYSVFYGGFADFNTHPLLSQRGLELMSKIQFDTITFTLFELKPISYEVFMQTYGKLNTTQSSTQTNENHMAIETQTEDYEVRSMWTQHPAQYDLQTVKKLTVRGQLSTQNCCGEFTAFNIELPPSKNDELDAAFQNLVDFRQSMSNNNQQINELRKPIDIERLHAFLVNSSAVMLRVLSYGSDERNLKTELRQANREFTIFSSGYIQLNMKFLNALRVVRVFSSPRHNLVITAHESLPEADVYRSDFSNLLMVWSATESPKPIRLLSAWSEVCRAEISDETPNIVVCGLRDGCVAMWDLRETYSFCSKLDGYLTHFAATQSIVPTWNESNDKIGKLFDVGSVVDIRSFRTRPKSIGLSNSLNRYKSIQFASLNDTGVLTIWTIVETTPNECAQLIVPTSKGSRKIKTPKSPNTRFEYISPWARLKLIQSAICDLRAYLERGTLKSQSIFERTKFLFEKNIYSDEILRELNESQSNLVRGHKQPQGLRFTCIDTGCELIYVCTNRNFILLCSKTLKAEKFRKISINEDGFLFPTALRVLTNEIFLAVGLSNGSVVILNCNQNIIKVSKVRTNVDSQRNEQALKTTKNHEAYDIDLETGKSCAIQNIILNERCSMDYELFKDYQTDCEMRPTTAACISLISNQKKPFELRVFDQQIVLSGSMLRKNLVKSLELSSDGWRLFALSDGEIRIYDFYLDREVTLTESTSKSDEKSKVMDIAVARTSHTEQNLIILTQNNNVDIHILLQ